MKILVNNSLFESTPEENIASLLRRLKISPHGIAVAVNDRVIPKISWETHSLHENDSLILIRAAQGG
jgi:sulfur carrier protein